MRHPNQAVSLADLDLRQLPSVDLLSTQGWWGVKRLPEAPGCYAVIATVKLREMDSSSNPQRLALIQRQARSVLGSSFLTMQTALKAGQWAQLVLYIGYSKDLRGRWAKDWDGDGNPDHHKFRDLNATGYLLNSLADLVDMRMHFLTTPEAEMAHEIEGHLIKLWRPILNDRPSLFDAGVTVEVSGKGKAAGAVKRAARKAGGRLMAAAG